MGAGQLSNEDPNHQVSQELRNIYLLPTCHLFFDTGATVAASFEAEAVFNSDVVSSVILAPPVGWPLRRVKAFQRTSK